MLHGAWENVGGNVGTFGPGLRPRALKSHFDLLNYHIIKQR